MTTNRPDRHAILKGTRHVDPLQVLQRTASAIEDVAENALMVVDNFGLAGLPVADRAAIEPRLVAALAKLERFRVEVTGGTPTRNAIRCQTCGDRFDAARADSAYCSPACRQRAYRRRKNDGQR